MKSSLAVAALANAVRGRRPSGTVVHSDRGSQFRSRRFVESLRHHGPKGSMGRVGARTRPPWNRSSRCCKRTSETTSGGSPARTSGWPSRPGSRRLTTASNGKDAWENSHSSKMEQTTGPRSQRPKTASQPKPRQSRVLDSPARQHSMVSCPSWRPTQWPWTLTRIVLSIGKLRQGEVV
jgi:hypothetical protein